MHVRVFLLIILFIDLILSVSYLWLLCTIDYEIARIFQALTRCFIWCKEKELCDI